MILGTLEILAESYTLAEKSGIAANEVHDLVKGVYLNFLLDSKPKYGVSLFRTQIFSQLLGRLLHSCPF
jgi:3-hydroxyisobutyrate dehydrogenase-like beta-hydroxyacid dehydrogenase